MRYRHVLCALALLLLPANAARAIEPSDLKPGLVTTYEAFRSGRVPPSVTRLEPTVALTLAKGETPHPTLDSVGRMAWKGYINVTRAGKYTFSAATEGGKLEVTVGGKDALATELQLDGGVIPFDATFRPALDAAGVRVELFWQGPGFTKEPLAYQFLGHLPKDRTPAFTKDGLLEHGRFKFEELSCAKCHVPAATDKMAKTLVEHTGPNLTEIGKRAYPGWIYAWLADPAKLRPHTTMPKYFTGDATADAERYAITQYLLSLSGKPLDVYKLPTVVPDQLKQSMDRGRVLYHVTGCAACHNDPIAKKKKDEDEEKEPLAPADYLFGQHTLGGPTAKYSLGELGSKFRPETLAAYLQNPLKTNPGGRMPHMNLNAAEATDIARYLCRSVDERVVTDKVPVPKVKPADVAPAYFLTATEAEKERFADLKADLQWIELGERVATTKGCMNCHAIEKNGKPIKPLPFGGRAELVIVKQGREKGCLDPAPNAAGSPVYKLDPKERDGTGGVPQGRPDRGRVARARVPGPRRTQAVQLPQLPPARRRGRHPGRTCGPDAPARKGRERRRRAPAGPHRDRAQDANRVAEVGPHAERARPAVDATPDAAVWRAERRVHAGSARVARRDRARRQGSCGRAYRGEVVRRPHHRRQGRAGLHLVPRHRGHRQHRHTRPGPRHHQPARPVRVVRAVAEPTAPHGARHADAAGVRRREIDAEDGLRRRPAQAGGGDVGVPRARPRPAASRRPRTAEGTGDRHQGSGGGAAHVPPGRGEQGHRRRLPRLRVDRVQRRSVPHRVRVGRQLHRRVTGVEQPRRRTGEVARPKVLDRDRRAPVGADDQPAHPPGLPRAGEQPGVRPTAPARTGPRVRRPVGGPVRRLQPRQHRQAHLPLPPRRNRERRVCWKSRRRRTR